MFTYNSPKHFVVSHVLHRLLVPRHPPCALINLTLFWSVDLKLIKSQRFGLFLVTIYNSISWIVEFDIDIQFSMDNLLNLSIQWSLAGSNRWPPACKAGALPAELWPLKWSGRQDSNLRPPGPKPGALPSCATSREMARHAGVEPTTFWSVVRRSIQLSYRCNFI